MSGLTRRDFLKVGSALSGAFAVSRLAPQLAASHSGSSLSAPHILIFVFDAMSAKNLSVYGYRRKTTPNFERFARRATVYNQHYSAANFTTPGTASLLTGLYPWTHRAFNQSGLIARAVTDHNVFRALGKQYYRLAFAQNLWPNYFFGQFGTDIEKVLSPAAFSLVDQIVGDKLPRDLEMAPDGRQARATVKGDRDPGYGSTSKMISECAICLLRDAPDVPAGISTPGAALQHKLIKRLVDHAGLTFAVEK